MTKRDARDEFDAYAKLENAITFLISDLTAFQDLAQKQAEFPLNLVKQFAKDLVEFKLDADLLKKTYHFSAGKETALLIWNTQDPDTHHTAGELTHARHFSRLKNALFSWAQAADGVLSEWKDSASGLTSLGKVVMQRMQELLKQIDSLNKSA